MRSANVLYKGEIAGKLIQYVDGTFSFAYNENWLIDKEKPAISLTFPKREEEYRSEYLFPFFYNMLPEGTNRMVVCKYLRIDENDYFGILLNTAKYDTIGAVTIEKIQ
ncbi:MAG: HipA N-terminal domain-containing protein [Bacteroidales bacterium]|nr:HipA N-terminal domain-containing protein [Bacteroidales bacterium]